MIVFIGENLLTESEIKKIKESVITITYEDVLQFLNTGKIRIINPTYLNNGYQVGYSIETMKNFDVHHISVCNSKGITDPADAECIARDFLGEGYKVIGSVHFKNVLHFTKFVKRKR